jgi:hypothetical protein
MILENKKLMSKALLKRLEFAEKSQRERSETGIIAKLDAFKMRLHSDTIKKDKYNWMSSKLLFPVDSINAFKTFEDKAKVNDGI